MSPLREMGLVMRAVPRPDASAAEVADWYERKAELWEHLAADGGEEAAMALERARVAHQHALAVLRGAAV